MNIQDGLIKDVLFNVMLIGGVSTLLFNGNPLLRFDGYYVLADAIEIPGLGKRANRYYLYLVQRYLFDVKEAKSPVTADGEIAWFVTYGAAAFVYRIFILVMITLWVTSGRVSSTPSDAAAPKAEVTPGTTSQSMPFSSNRIICSLMAP